jgi:hypothetical protein
MDMIGFGGGQMDLLSSYSPDNETVDESRDEPSNVIANDKSEAATPSRADDSESGACVQDVDVNRSGIGWAVEVEAVKTAVAAEKAEEKNVKAKSYDSLRALRLLVKEKLKTPEDIAALCNQQGVTPRPLLLEEAARAAVECFYREKTTRQAKNLKFLALASLLRHKVSDERVIPFLIEHGGIEGCAKNESRERTVEREAAGGKGGERGSHTPDSSNRAARTGLKPGPNEILCVLPKFRDGLHNIQIRVTREKISFEGFIDAPTKEIDLPLGDGDEPEAVSKE